MRILIIGASGHVGSAAMDVLSREHEVVGVSRSTSPAVDLRNQDSISQLFVQLGKFDAVISAFGAAPFKSTSALDADDYTAAFTGKVLSQLNLVRIGRDYVNDGGSFTLITGILAREPIPTGAAAAMANGAVEAFVMAASGEMPRGIRLNAVSPTVLEAATAYHRTFAGFEPVASEIVGQAFLRSIEGIANGRVYKLD
jgi:NAD(P)-dependent dehydrogenase (short-subunit alcohol dehydrogenase family)